MNTDIWPDPENDISAHLKPPRDAPGQQEARLCEEMLLFSTSGMVLVSKIHWQQACGTGLPLPTPQKIPQSQNEKVKYLWGVRQGETESILVDFSFSCVSISLYSVSG